MYRYLILLLLPFISYAEECDLLSSPAEELANGLCLFSKPLIVGASVSAGYGVSSDPGSLVARGLNPAADITNHAVSGATSLYLSRFINAENNPSVVMAFDLFFWDTARSSCGNEFIENTRMIFRRLAKTKTPFIVGKIPVGASFPVGLRLASRSTCANIVNRLIDENCQIENNCIVYNPRSCLDAMGSPVSSSGRSYFIDPIHTSSEGNRFCAEQFIQNGSFKRLRCRVDGAQ